jgi:uncharacterized repeat protein (TIGR02543 family)
MDRFKKASSKSKGHLFLLILLAALLSAIAAGNVCAAPFAYISNNAANTVSVIDTGTNTVVDTIAVGSYPLGVTVNPSGSRVYVANHSSDTVSVIDTSTNAVVETISVGSGPQGIAVNPSGSRVYVANTASHNVSVIDTSTHNVVDTIPTGSNAVGVAVNPSGSRVYVTNAGNNNVSVIDPTNNSIVATIPVGSNPHGVAVNPSGTRVYVRNGDSTVSVIDTGTNTVVDTITVGSGPHTFGKFIGPGECAQPPANLVSWWKAENNANDSIGTNHGTMRNGATFATGKVGQAFRFDGVDDYVSTPDSPIFDFGIDEFTIGAWINTATPLSLMRLISAGSEADGEYNLWAFGYGSHPYWGTGNRLNFAIYDADGYPYTDLNSNEINLSADTWHHIAVVRSGSNLTFYFDGDVVGTANIGSINLRGGTTGAIIGARYWTGPSNIIEHANGLIDEVAIFNRALTAEEIAAIYNAGGAGMCSINRYTLTVTKAGTGTGTVTSMPTGIDCGGTCEADFNENTLVTLTATPGSFSTFAGWSGDCSGTNPTIQVTMDANKTCTATFTAWKIILIALDQGVTFTACSYYNLPLFKWDTNETFKSLEVQFSSQSNFATLLKAKGNPAVKELQMTSAIWKKVLLLPGPSGGTVYWRVVGTKADKTVVISNVRSFSVEEAEEAGTPSINPTSIAGLPTLSWNNNCNIKFKVWFGNDPDFTKAGMKKKALAFNISNPNDNGGVFTRELTSGQWTSIHKLVGSVPGSRIYWYVESWDVVKRYKKTSVTSFTLMP